uniref:Uncharacterized protein n=1 Tax=Palpitomonas bilix TaxID=652834 RepID=A0A7S3DGV5_9EUKA|mmetsp:Transcript_37019/g.95981  ORF Transcript_37019/g.95981 Transcript_37019/m.95981 type:complete len:178 (+) Transcript_37019:138-671(+)
MLKFVKVFDVEEDIRSVPFSETEHSRKDLRGPLEGHAVASVHEETDLRVVGHERDGFLVLCRIHHEKQRVYFDLFDVQSMKKYFLFEFRGAANVVSASVDPARKYIGERSKMACALGAIQACYTAFEFLSERVSASSVFATLPLYKLVCTSDTSCYCSIHIRESVARRLDGGRCWVG